jgi:ectoine hydroxylase-related dioxygenase (phytanoyl-CoA dioxygenase family)
MTTTPNAGGLLSGARLRESDCRLEDFAALLEQQTAIGDFHHADHVERNVVIYDSERLREAIRDEADRLAVEAELAWALSTGPGIVGVQGAFADLDVVDRATAVFDDMIADQGRRSEAVGDHFAKPGANDRVWNALEKLAVRDPETFVDYYANEVIALVSAAWLGPGYQVTSQVNVVRPGGIAQDPHRDYHLGFLSNAVAERFPAHVHCLSPALTLQGAVAHSDMPVESGPTMYLPYSHQYAPGYLAWRLPEFREYFVDHHVQLPLAKGDAVFFNPALFHGAGSNVSTDIQRMANLLQVSSAFGRAMEQIDRTKTAKAIYPVLAERLAAGMPLQLLENAVAAAGEGYPFPTNLDRDQPVGGLTPLAQTDILLDALVNGVGVAEVSKRLDDYAARRQTSEI